MLLFAARNVDRVTEYRRELSLINILKVVVEYRPKLKAIISKYLLVSGAQWGIMLAIEVQNFSVEDVRNGQLIISMQSENYFPCFVDILQIPFVIICNCLTDFRI